MSRVIYGPGTAEPDSPALLQAYKERDAEIHAYFKSMVDVLLAFAQADHNVAIAGFDTQRYVALQRDARQASSDLHRSLTRWATTVS